VSAAPSTQGCHNGRFLMKITIRTSVDVVRRSAHVRIYPTDAVLPADADAREKKTKQKKIIYFWQLLHAWRKKKFGFRFSIPKIPEIPEIRGRSREKKKVFSA
jgi:hypothetical protein